MARRKKLIRRNRLLRWAVPYLRNRAAQDAGCTGGHPPEARCIRCDALRNLEYEDWEAVDFHDYVADQFVNHEPMGRSDGRRPYTTLRLEALLAACELLGVPADDRLRLVEDARFLHRLVAGNDAGAWREGVPTELPDLDGFGLPADSPLRAVVFDPRRSRGWNSTS